jgi:hypothetical protein
VRPVFAIPLSAVVLFGAGWFLIGSVNVVTSRYESLNDARADHLFGRGWLPDILPPSAGGIRTSNNLDLNTSEGEFSFATSDYAAFAARLQPYGAIDAPFVNFEGKVEQMRADGLHPAVFEDDTSTWIFFCNPEGGHCLYTMWLRGS